MGGSDVSYEHVLCLNVHNVYFLGQCYRFNALSSGAFCQKDIMILIANSYRPAFEEIGSDTWRANHYHVLRKMLKCMLPLNRCRVTSDWTGEKNGNAEY